MKNRLIGSSESKQCSSINWKDENEDFHHQNDSTAAFLAL
jgi:hypothetical protein